MFILRIKQNSYMHPVGKIQNFLMLKQLIPIVTFGLERVNYIKTKSSMLDV
jgi:hypothetical protein